MAQGNPTAPEELAPALSYAEHQRPARAARSASVQTPHLSVVIVNFCQWRNTLRLTRQLCAAASVRSGAAEVVVIDNHSPVHAGVNRLRRPDNAMILVTHYQRMLEYVVPDRVHVLFDGRIVKSGGRELALELERRGYDWIREEVAAAQTAGV